jgi:hypothetical protein
MVLSVPVYFFVHLACHWFNLCTKINNNLLIVIVINSAADEIHQGFSHAYKSLFQIMGRFVALTSFSLAYQKQKL